MNLRLGLRANRRISIRPAARVQAELYSSYLVSLRLVLSLNYVQPWVAGTTEFARRVTGPSVVLRTLRSNNVYLLTYHEKCELMRAGGLTWLHLHNTNASARKHTRQGLRLFSRARWKRARRCGTLPCRAVLAR